VPFEYALQIHRLGGGHVEPKALAREFRKGKLPSAEALVLGDRLPDPNEENLWSAALRVPVEDIESITAELPSGAQAGGSVVLGVALFVAVIVAVVAIAAHNRPQPQQSCGGDSNFGSGWLSGVQVNPRPFDRSRGCFVGDPLAAADPWPVPVPAGVATARSDRTAIGATGDALGSAPPPSAR
jgi:hypothetical protein